MNHRQRLAKWYLRDLCAMTIDESRATRCYMATWYALSSVLYLGE